MTGGDLLHGVDDVAVPEEELLGARRIEPQQVGEGAGGEWCRQLRAEFGDTRRCESRHEFSGTCVHPCGVFGELIS